MNEDNTELCDIWEETLHILEGTMHFGLMEASSVLPEHLPPLSLFNSDFPVCMWFVSPEPDSRQALRCHAFQAAHAYDLHREGGKELVCA